MATLNAPKQAGAVAQLDANDNVVAILIGQQTNPPAGVNPGGAPGNQPSGGNAGGAPAFLRVPVRLSQGGIPYGIANSGTVATNGTVTLGTALPTTYSGGIFLYFPSTALAAPLNVAGWYFCVMSSTTVGVVYVPVASNPASTATVATGSNAGYTGVVTAQTALNVNVPAACLGANGQFNAQFDFGCNNSAGAKVGTVYWNGTGGSSLSAVSLTTSTELSVRIHGRNQGATNLQYITVNDNQAAGGTTGVTRATVDTTVAVPITVTLSVAVATDVIVLDGWFIELIPSASQFGGAS